MKTLNKKIMTACLALMMAVAMAMPAFAAELSTQEEVVALAGYNRYDLGTCSLNLYGNGSFVYDNQNVNIYTTDPGSDDQIWLGIVSGKEPDTDNKKNRYILQLRTSITLGGTYYVLNANMTGSEWNANVKPFDLANQEIFMGSRGSTNAAEIYLSHHKIYSLLAKGNTSGSNVVFSPSYHSDWKVVWQNVGNL